ncbi:hypothetical protein F2Q70_00001156 [Brassica cretica]|uniref:Riboflavin synthase n=1 Tax=Brassica cretica TaxID=69181 RepID=A0A8S9IP80_BRACR|nr:hypothetical protein F2Q70_00001156 [Brassica cretica]
MTIATHSLNLLPTSLRPNLLRFDSFSPNSSKTLTTTTHGRRQNLSIRSLFTGIVEEMGQVKDLGSADRGGFDLKIGARVVLEDVKLGDSISVNGTCLTRRSSPSGYHRRRCVKRRWRSWREDLRLIWSVKADKGLVKYIVPKGFVAVDGTSLTVVDVSDEESCFDFMLVAYTQQKVVIPSKKIGQEVNLEVDIMGKYVERLLTTVGFSPLSASP